MKRALAGLVVALGLMLPGAFPLGKGEHCHAQQGPRDNPEDCAKVKKKCNRDSGCKCVLRCDGEGNRLPQTYAECPAACCESMWA